MYKFLIALAVLPAIFGLDFNHCPVGNSPNFGSSDNCDSVPCNIVRGDSMVARANFTAPFAATQLNLSVIGRFIVDIPIPFPADQADACLNGWIRGPNGAAASCPLVAGQTYEWHCDIPIDENFPLLSLPLTGNANFDRDAFILFNLFSFF